MPVRHALVAEWPSGLGKGLQSPVHGFDSRLRLCLRYAWCSRPPRLAWAICVSKPHSLSGANYGDGPVALITTIIVAVLVGYLAVRRPDIQQPGEQQTGRSAVVSDGVVGR